MLTPVDVFYIGIGLVGLLVTGTWAFCAVRDSLRSRREQELKSDRKAREALDKLFGGPRDDIHAALSGFRNRLAGSVCNHWNTLIEVDSIVTGETIAWWCEECQLQLDETASVVQTRLAEQKQQTMKALQKAEADREWRELWVPPTPGETAREEQETLQDVTRAAMESYRKYGTKPITAEQNFSDPHLKGRGPAPAKRPTKLLQLARQRAAVVREREAIDGYTETWTA